MPFRPGGKGFVPKNQRSTLVNARLQVTNNADYQNQNQVLNGLGQFKEELDSKRSVTTKIDASKELSGLVPWQNGGVQTGRYIPTLINTANISASAAYYTFWIRTGNLIKVFGKVTIDCVASGTLTQLEMSLPINARLISEEQVSGLANGVPFAGSTADFAGIVKANPVNGYAIIHFYSTNTADNDVRFDFTYLYFPPV